MRSKNETWERRGYGIGKIRGKTTNIRGSYSSEYFVEELVRDLKGDGIPVWFPLKLA